MKLKLNGEILFLDDWKLIEGVGKGKPLIRRD